MIPINDALLFMSLIVVASVVTAFVYETWLHWNGRRCGGAPCSTCTFLMDYDDSPAREKHPRRTRGRSPR